MTNEELAVRIRDGEDLRLQLWEQVRRWIAKYAAHWYSAFDGKRGVELDDLLQSGYLAFEDALGDFDADSGTFVNWLTLRLKTAFAELYGVRTERTKNEPLNNAVSLSAPLEDDTDGLTVADTTRDKAAEEAFAAAENKIFVEQLREALEAALADLAAEQADVVRKKYFLRQGEREICESTNLNESAVRSLTRSGLSEMRRLHGRELGGFLPFNPYSGTGYGAWKSTGTSIEEKFLIFQEKSEGNENG